MTRRRLTPEELALWRKVARTAERMQPGRIVLDRDKPRHDHAMKPVSQKVTPPPPLTPFTIGARSGGDAPGDDVLPGLAQQLAREPLKMDSRIHARLKRGKLTPEARIDLHGMTVERAHPALTGFVLRAQAAGLRLVLVITGKGKRGEDDGPIPRRHGVLRHAVPQWLSSAPLAQAVLQVTEAHARHGGGGAYYVYLRRQR